MSRRAPIRTERLVLRPVAVEDAAAVLRFRSDPAATQFLSHEPLGPEENIARLVQLVGAADASSVDWFNFGWVIELRETGEVIGEGRTWNSAEPPGPGRIPADCASLGYVLHPAHHGRGLAREAAGALVSWLFEERGTQTVFAGVYEPNLPSQRLLAGLGFRQDRHFSASQDTTGKYLPSRRYRLDRSSRPTIPRTATKPGAPPS